MNNEDSAAKNSFSDQEGDKYYIAPEVLEGKVSTAADIFSLGLILLELVTNIDLPSSGEAWEALRYNANFTLSNIESTFTTLMITMLNPIPENRPTASSILNQLGSMD